MEKQTEKIVRFSKVVYVLLNVAIVVFIVIGALTLVAWLLSGINLPTETITLNGVDMEVPYLFKFGDTKVYMPIIWKSGFDFSSMNGFNPGLLDTRFLYRVGIEDFLGIIFTIIGLRFAKRVFKLLRENGSPFREDVIKALKRLTVVLLITGGVAGAIPFLAAGLVWVLCLIFDYGRILQYESDTTL